MNQQEFERRSAELKDELRAAKRALAAKRAAAGRRLAEAKADGLAKKNEAVREYRDAVYDLATKRSPRSGAFLAGQMAAANARDARCAEIDEWLRCEERAFLDRSEELRKALEAGICEHRRRKEALLREYGQWLESRRSNRSAVREMMDQRAALEPQEVWYV